jgi:site-specific recombinase XerD
MAPNKVQVLITMDIELLTRKFCEYLKYMKGYSQETVDRYKWVLGLYIRLAGLTTIEDVTEENVRQLFFIGRTQRNWKPATFIIYFNSLTVFFRWCITNKYIEVSPMKDIEIPKVEKYLPTRLTRQDAMKLLEVVYNYPYEYAYLRYRNHAIFSTFLFAGLRKSELLQLKLTDVDIPNLSIFVNQGKGNKDRILPMTYTLAESLKRYLIERKKLGRTCPEFFVSLNLNSGYTKNGLKRLVVKIRKASAINFTIHKLRHTFATLMLEGGCDIYSLSKMMGHSDIKTTTIYLSASAEHLRSQVSKHPLNDIVRFN